MTTAEALDRGRGSFGRHAWADAYAELSVADHEAPLGATDLERLAMAAFLLGRTTTATMPGRGRFTSAFAWAMHLVPPGARSGWA